MKSGIESKNYDHNNNSDNNNCQQQHPCFTTTTATKAEEVQKHSCLKKEVKDTKVLNREGPTTRTTCCWPLRMPPSLPGTAPAMCWRSWCQKTRTGGRTPALRTRTGSDSPSDSGQCASPPGCPQCSGKQQAPCMSTTTTVSQGKETATRTSSRSNHPHSDCPGFLSWSDPVQLTGC